MKYAVVSISGSQFKITEDQKITVNNLNLEEGKTGSTDQVLLIADGDKIEIGEPTIKDAKVDYKIVKNYQGKKVRVFKYKSKSRYRKTMGFRPQLTDIQITKITTK
ncbi:MAG: 50S ribosomal protein L21 [Bacteriovorax sp.]|nr:50S ribosomal protein L21 [Bacteriovorax sp.]